MFLSRSPAFLASVTVKSYVINSVVKYQANIPSEDDKKILHYTLKGTAHIYAELFANFEIMFSSGQDHGHLGLL